MGPLGEHANSQSLISLLPAPTSSSSLTDPEHPRGVPQEDPLTKWWGQPLRAGNGVCEDGLQAVKFSFIQVKETHSWKTKGEAEDMNYL